MIRIWGIDMTNEHPGITVRQLLEDEEFDTDEMYEMLAVSDGYGERLLSGNAPMSQSVANALEAAGFATASYWMRAQVKYDRERL